ncbi:MAG TPA: homoserine O-succinyltransferase [Acidobacteriaceae bacterium]|jgi:homoserine O-succinyltransferase|nr:homoserine O-succinyltransferase [Acidobacteriaceae bacterium]
MPVYLNTNPTGNERQPCTNGLSAKPSAECFELSSKSLTIGLINNMSDGALEATERQFLSVLDSASEGISIQLSLYSLPGVPRSESGARHVSQSYSSTENLLDMHLDGLIVTGREPLTPNLTDEPYWESFTRVLDWARDNTYSAVWSCLAAHAALLHMDGIRRIKSNKKHFGVFEYARQANHPLLAGAPSRFKLPHSRWNGIPEDELTSCGYSILTRAADVGVDTFIKQHNSLFVFFQGHPEYESNTLLLEYRRDVGRYLRGETNTFPPMPQGYFDRDTVTALTVLQQESQIRPREELLAEVFRILENVSVESTWRSTTTCIYRNWLEYICAQKQQQLKDNNIAVKAHGLDGPTPHLAIATDVSRSAVYATNLSQARHRLLRATR